MHLAKEYVMNKIKKLALTLFLLTTLAACDTGIREMGVTEYGVVFRKMPPIIGGGVSDKVIPAAQKVILWPWDTIYRFDTAEKYVSWGGSLENKAQGGDPLSAVAQVNVVVPTTGKGYVYTRAVDGNEVALAVTVVYRITPDPEKLIKLVKEVATSDAEVRSLVIAVGRADIRTAMNRLRTAEFAEADSRYGAVRTVQKMMNERLNRYGIEVTKVTLDDFQFERLLRDGVSVDSSYQEKLTLIQQRTEETAREMARIQTVKALKGKEYNDMLLNKKQAEQAAEGYRNQAKFRADAYFNTKKNEADGILAKGTAEAEGLVQQIEALSGSGGQALLKIELARQLVKADPKFVILDQSNGKGGQGGASIDVRRTDTNEILSQIGVLEGLRKDPAVVPSKNLAKSEKE